jgi:hypothetical protein
LLIGIWDFSEIAIEENVNQPSQIQETVVSSDPHFDDFVIRQNLEAEEC